MSLKPDRDIYAWELGYYLNETADPGVVPVIKTASSGADLDGSDNEVEITASPSGKTPVGVLLDEFVNIDLTKFHLNQHKAQQDVGAKASIARRGWVVTDKVKSGESATAGKYAVLEANGEVKDAPAGWDVTHENNPKVGRFMSDKDENGFVRLFIDCQ